MSAAWATISGNDPPFETRTGQPPLLHLKHVVGDEIHHPVRPLGVTWSVRGHSDA
jgi:hypothetical protein